jgi:tetratricopeptide (TPR) repeat protein
MRRSGLRSRWPRWPVTVTVAGAAIGGGAAAVVRWPHAWWWLVVVTAVAAAVMPPALTVVLRASQRRQEIGQATRAGLQGTGGVTGAKLPIVGAANLEARVHQTVLPIPYIQRDQEETIRVHLRARHPVLLIGSSMVGKTKMASRVIADEFSGWPVAIPDSKTALADLDAKDVLLQDSVIWLDDVDRLIGIDGITDGALRRLIASGNVIVSTIRARAYDQLQPSDQLRLPEWDVLSVFEHVFVRRDLSQREQEQLADAIAYPDIRDRIQTVGLGEYVGAARQIAEALELGAAGTDPLGYALVLAAADWRRCGMTRPIPASLLAPMALSYLDNRGRALLADQETFNAGLAWAMHDINPNVALLQTAGTDSYAVYDYALDLISAQGRPIPDGSWAIVMANADAPELVSISFTATASYSRDEIAAQALVKAANSEDSQTVAIATMLLGTVLLDHGDVPGAKEVFQKAIESEDSKEAGWAAYHLGRLLRNEGDLPGAKEAYQKVIDSGNDSTPAPHATFSLGELLRNEGDLPGAKEAYQKAIDSGNVGIAALAKLQLGLLLAEEGDVPGAKEAIQEASGGFARLLDQLNDREI